MSGDGGDAVMDPDLFPADRGFSYRIGQRLEVQDTFGNWFDYLKIDAILIDDNVIFAGILPRFPT